MMNNSTKLEQISELTKNFFVYAFTRYLDVCNLRNLAIAVLRPLVLSRSATWFFFVRQPQLSQYRPSEDICRICSDWSFILLWSSETLCLFIIHFGQPCSIYLEPDYKESVHPFIRCIVISIWKQPKYVTPKYVTPSVTPFCMSL